MPLLNNVAVLLDPLAIAVIVVTGVVFPPVGVWEFRRLVHRNATGVPAARMAYYRWVIASEWVCVIVLVGSWFASGRDAGTLGLVFRPAGWQWLAVGAGLALVGVLVLQGIAITRSADQLAELPRQSGALVEMIPRNPRERRAFRLLALTAGICEEILYRGLLLAFLASALGTWPAVLLSSVLFGLAHIYQGPAGFAKTGIIGLVLALLTVFSGSLYTAIVAHAALDLVSGRILEAALEAPAEVTAPSS